MIVLSNSHTVILPDNSRKAPSRTEDFTAPLLYNTLPIYARKREREKRTGERVCMYVFVRVFVTNTRSLEGFVLLTFSDKVVFVLLSCELSDASK